MLWSLQLLLNCITIYDYQGHLAALRLLEKEPVGIHTVNLGTGSGYSVLDMVAAMKVGDG